MRESGSHCKGRKRAIGRNDNIAGVGQRPEKREVADPGTAMKV